MKNEDSHPPNFRCKTAKRLPAMCHTRAAPLFRRSLSFYSIFCKTAAEAGSADSLPDSHVQALSF